MMAASHKSNLAEMCVDKSYSNIAVVLINIKIPKGLGYSKQHFLLVVSCLV